MAIITVPLRRFWFFNTQGSSVNSINFTGQRLDYETGLMPLGNGERYYSSGLGRFIQQDSFSGVLSVPASLNRYSYAHNNPVIHTDPSGNVIPLLIGLAVFGLAFYAGVKAVETRDTVEARNQEMIKQGADASTLPNANIVGIFDGSFVGSGFRAATGTDPVTGEELSKKRRVFEGALVGLELFGPVKGAFRGGASKGARAGAELLEESSDAATTISRSLSKVDEVDQLQNGLKQAAKSVEEQYAKYSDDISFLKQLEEGRQSANVKSLRENAGSYPGFGMVDEIASTVGESKKLDVALGLRRDPNGNNIIEKFANDVNAVHNGRWIEEGLAEGGPFVQRFYQATYRSISRGGKLKFNLDYVKIDEALQTPRFSDPFTEMFGHPTNVTNWELQQILNNKMLYENTEFYIGGQKLLREDILEFGLGFRGM